MTIGTESLGVRVVRGRLNRNGVWRQWQPCIFLLLRGRRVLG
jgi:hypothetical protein